MAYTLKRFGSTNFGLRADTHDIGTGAAQTNFYDLPGGGAFDALGGEWARRGVQSVVLSGLLVAATAASLKTQFAALRGLRGKRDKLYRATDDTGAEEWVWARLLDVRCPRTYNHKLHLPVELEFAVVSGYWHGNPHFGVVNLTPSATTMTIINNGGNAISNHVVARLTAGNAPITGTTTIKMVTGLGKICEYTWTGTIAATKSLVVDSAAQSVKNDGADAYGSFALTASHQVDDWMRVDPGDNDVYVTITGGGASPTIRLDFEDGWH